MTQPSLLPRSYNDLAFHVASYLHGLDIVPSPLAPQEDDIGVFINAWADTPDTAVMITSPWEFTGRDSDTIPELRFMVAHRAVDQSDLWKLQTATFRALHQPSVRFRLTGTVDMIQCGRIISDPPVPDANSRWVAVDTYRCRPYRHHER